MRVPRLETYSASVAQIEVFVAGPGIDADPALEHVGGEQDWTVACPCGVADDDGERMLQCDVCQTWLHAHCSGIPASAEDPEAFVCARCSETLVA